MPMGEVETFFNTMGPTTNNLLSGEDSLLTVETCGAGSMKAWVHGL